jgi:hypothetical protein
MQVAAYADHHILVSKSVRDGRADTRFEVLQSGPTRIAEIAAMMDVDAAVAEKLLEQARADVARPGGILQGVGGEIVGSRGESPGPEEPGGPSATLHGDGQSQEVGGEVMASGGDSVRSAEPGVSPSEMHGDGQSQDAGGGIVASRGESSGTEEPGGDSFVPRSNGESQGVGGGIGAPRKSLGSADPERQPSVLSCNDQSLRSAMTERSEGGALGENLSREEPQAQHLHSVLEAEPSRR